MAKCGNVAGRKYRVLHHSRHPLVEANIGLAYSIGLKWYFRVGVNLPCNDKDFIGAAVEGLITAGIKYESVKVTGGNSKTRGERRKKINARNFFKYAKQVIEHHVQDYSRAELYRGNHFGPNMNDALAKIRKSFGREFPDQESFFILLGITDKFRGRERYYKNTYCAWLLSNPYRGNLPFWCDQGTDRHNDRPG